MNNYSVISPNSNVKFLWEIIIFFIIIYFVVILTLQFAFSQNLEVFMNISAFYSLILVLLFDILINLNSAYYYKGNIENNRSKIIVNFFKNNFLVEFISFLSIFSALYNANSYEYFNNMLFLVKLGRTSMIIKKIEERFDF